MSRRFGLRPQESRSNAEFTLDGFTLGIATTEAAKEHHGLSPGEGRGIEIAFWTDDTDAASAALTAMGALDHGEISSLAFPGMATGIGAVDPEVAAKQMARAFREVLGA